MMRHTRFSAPPPFRWLVAFCSLALGSLGAIGRPPNVVLILTDDQGFGDVGFSGNPVVQTPVLVELAGRGTIFDRFYASPVCSPTRASLMTGRYAFRTGVIDTQEGMSILRPSEWTLAEALQEAGYRTGMFGKWHLGDNAPARPLDQGFESSLTHVGGMIGAPYNPLDGNAYFDPVLIEDGVEKRFEGYCTDIFAAAAIDFIRSAEERPFFLFFAPNAPHHPLTVAEAEAEPYQRSGLSVETSRYYGMISNLDANVGRILECLRECGVAENTQVVFLGDNGTSSLHKQADLWEPGLRGRKTYVYENGIRVPMFIYLPGEEAMPERQATPASVEDIMPTILEACGVPLPEGLQLDGASLLPLLRGDSSAWPERTFFAQFHRGLRPVPFRNSAVLQGSLKLVQPVGRGIQPYAEELARFELYDLDEDPFESRDLAADHPEIVDRLKAEYRRWFEDVCQDGFEPVRSWIGSASQPRVVLTRQDWQGGGLFDGALGTYALEVKQAGRYRITCRWSELLKEAHPVTLQIGDQVWRKEILYAESQCRFDEVFLPAGPCQLTAWIEFDGARRGFRFIEIERL